MKAWMLLVSALFSTEISAQDQWRCTDRDGNVFTLNQKTLVDKCEPNPEYKPMTVKIRKDREAAKKGVYVGMTREEVLQSSWGRPRKVNTTTTARGISEQWVYSSGNYLYFRDGVLVTIQN